jgi:hypothetical protein
MMQRLAEQVEALHHHQMIRHRHLRVRVNRPMDTVQMVELGLVLLAIEGQKSVLSRHS